MSGVLLFEWDENKAASNRKKHGVDFDLAAHVFEDPDALLAQGREVDGEQRWQTIGMVGGLLVLLVAHTVRNEGDEEIIRIISARRATKKERKRYDQESQKNRD